MNTNILSLRRLLLKAPLVSLALPLFSEIRFAQAQPSSVIDAKAEILGISEMSVYRMRYKGELQPKAKWGGKNYWDGTEVMDYCIKRGVIKEEGILTT